jgi:hypothetical protein
LRLEELPGTSIVAILQSDAVGSAAIRTWGALSTKSERLNVELAASSTLSVSKVVSKPTYICVDGGLYLRKVVGSVVHRNRDRKTS